MEEIPREVQCSLAESAVKGNEVREKKSLNAESCWKFFFFLSH